MVKKYDTVTDANLWYKLSEKGITGKMLTVIKSMYSNVKSCISVNGFYTDFFS